MSQSAIAIAGGGESPNAKVRAKRTDAGKEKEKTEKCGCCGKMFVTLARHYRYKKVTDEDGVSNKPSKCAAWAISQGIDAKSLSKEKSGPASPAGRKAILRSLKCLENATILTAIQVKNLMKTVDAKFPEAEEAEDEEEDDE
jgi:hypothetical protein